MNKFGAKKTIIGDLKFDSKKEADYYCKLVLLKNAKEESERVIDIELQPRFDYMITYSANGKNKSKPAFYKADFRVKYADGNEKIIDVKGCKKSTAYNTFKRKKKIIEALYNIQIIEV